MPGPAPLRLAIFDCDGTLVDSQHMIAACMRAAFDAEGLPPPGIAEVRRVVGLPLADCMRVLAPGYGPDGHSRLAEAFRVVARRSTRSRRRAGFWGSRPPRVGGGSTASWNATAWSGVS
jgi:phosphoglycolate phosphatase